MTRIHHIIYPLLTAVSCIALSACSTHLMKKHDFANRAPVIQYGASDGYGSAGVHTVLAGETIQTIARFYHLTPADIITVNDLAAPYRLTKGTRLILPPPQTYRVRPGDTIGLIARTFDIAPDAIIATNGTKIQPGQDIRLPRLAGLNRSTTNQMTDDTALSKLQDMAAPLASAIRPSPVFAAGPGRDPVQVASLGPIGMGATSTAHPFGDAPVIPSQKPNFMSRQNSNKITAAVSPTWSITPGPLGPGGFSRPVQGPIVSTYGPKSGGLYNEGVNIAAPKGSPVRAAQDGTVVYVGDAVEGYGNLVLVKHPGGYITAYAHMDKALVKDHQQIRQGQVIGTVGTTGNVSRAQLHFEIRKGRDSINPLQMI